MGMSSGNDGNRTMADINVTPLVDVMLVLLIIMMVTAPMLNSSGVDVDLPKAEAPPLDMSKDEQLILGIDKDLRYFINKNEFPWAEMGVKLMAIAKANPDQPVFIKADGAVPYREVARLLGAAKLAGMPRVGLVFDSSGTAAPEDAP